MQRLASLAHAAFLVSSLVLGCVGCDTGDTFEPLIRPVLHEIDANSGDRATEEATSPSAPLLVEPGTSASKATQERAPSDPTDVLPRCVPDAPPATSSQHVDDALAQVEARLTALRSRECLQQLSNAELVLALEPLSQHPHETAQLGMLWIRRGDHDPDLYVVAGDLPRPWVAVFQARDDGSVPAVIAVSDSGLGGRLRASIEEADAFPDPSELLLLSARAFRIDGQSTPQLALANTFPWPSSCWRSLRFSVFGASGAPHRPDVRFSSVEDGRFCDGIDLDATPDGVAFSFSSWASDRNIAADVVERPRVVSLQPNAAGTLLAQFPRIAGEQEPIYLIADWLEHDWWSAQRAVRSDAPAALQWTHAALRARDSSGDYATEVLERHTDHMRVRVRCNDPATGTPCVAWPAPVDFGLVRNRGSWWIRDVTVGTR